MKTYVSNWLLLPKLTDVLLMQSMVTVMVKETSNNAESTAFLTIQSVEVVEDKTATRVSGTIETDDKKKNFTGFFTWDNDDRRGGKLFMIAL